MPVWGTYHKAIPKRVKTGFANLGQVPMQKGVVATRV